MKVDLVGVGEGEAAVVLICRGLGAALRCDLECAQQSAVTTITSRRARLTCSCLFLLLLTESMKVVFDLL